MPTRPSTKNPLRESSKAPEKAPGIPVIVPTSTIQLPPSPSISPPRLQSFCFSINSPYQKSITDMEMIPIDHLHFLTEIYVFHLDEYINQSWHSVGPEQIPEPINCMFRSVRFYPFCIPDRFVLLFGRHSRIPRTDRFPNLEIGFSDNYRSVLWYLSIM